MSKLKPTPLLTIRRMSALSGKAVSYLKVLLDEHPDIQPVAVADQEPVFDRDDFARLLAIIDQADAAQEAAR